VTLARQVALIARRSVVRTLRQPANVIPPLTFPLLLMAVNSNGLEAATRLPGFPSDSFLDFFLPFSFMQGALFAASTAGTDLARDVDTGFLNRLALTPMRGLALIVGQLGGAVTMGAVQALVYLGVGLAFGVRFETGVAGVAVLFVLAVLIVLGWAGVGVLLALRTGSGEAVQSQFPIMFFLLFLSSMNLPRDLIEIEWFRIAATVNPASYMIEGLRVLIIEGWDAQALVLGFGFALAVIAISLGASAVALRQRMART
jgi:ABC-2 type transport system permease protein